MSASESDLSLVASETEAAVVVQTALHAARPTVLHEDGTYAYLVPDGSAVEVVHGRDPLPAPRRKVGTVRLLDATSFAAYTLKHNEAEATELYADPRTPGVTAVLNGHDSEFTGYGDHRAVLVFQPTTSWQRWAANNGKLLTQVQFAEHIEAALPDIVTPPGADMLELAESFQAHTKVQFLSSNHLGSGQRQLTYREEVEAGAGTRGQLTIPKEFELGLVPYEGAARYKVTARLRYRISDGRLQLGYVLDRPEDVQRAAFSDVLKQVQEQTGRIALLGTPA